MEIIKKRIFIRNLPPDVEEAIIQKKFGKFGSVTNIEIKTGSDITTPSCYAFLDLETEARRLNSCFQKLSKDWNGHSVKVEFAKESFLSRLQKERQQANAETNQNTSTTLKFDCTTSSDGHLKSNDNQLRNSSKKKKCIDSERRHGKEIEPSSIDSERSKNINPAPVPAEYSGTTGLLQKFEAFSDVWKDPPTFNNQKQDKPYRPSVADDELEVTQAVKTDGQLYKTGGKSPTSSKKILNSEEKRLSSLQERERSYLQQKEAVQLALASVDSNIKTNKKIIFDDDMDEESGYSNNNVKQLGKSQCSASKGRQGPKLFEDETVEEDQEQDYDFNIRRQFEGKKGQKLLDLQSRYANDKRFTLDDRFYESDDSDAQDETQPPEEGSLEEERRKQLEILQSIVGTHLPHTPEVKKTKTGNVDNMVVHYDPIDDDHAKYEINRKETKKVAASFNTRQEKRLEDKRAKKKQKKELLTPQLPTVSKEKFYKVSETLKESLKSDGKGFSLLEMFGSIDESKQSATNEDTYSCVNTTKRKSPHPSSNPFKWDSSDSEDEAEGAKVSSELQHPSQSEGVTQGRGIWQESFFLRANDERLTEGLKFFSQDKGLNEDFSQRRREVQKIVSTKIRKNLRKTTSLRLHSGKRKMKKMNVRPWRT